jgi:hypothetical protein
MWCFSLFIIFSFFQVLGLHHSQIIDSITRFGTRSAAILHKLDELAVSLPQDYDNDSKVTSWESLYLYLYFIILFLFFFIVIIKFV